MAAGGKFFKMLVGHELSRGDIVIGDVEMLVELADAERSGGAHVLIGWLRRWVDRWRFANGRRFGAGRGCRLGGSRRLVQHHQGRRDECDSQNNADGCAVGPGNAMTL